MQKTNKTRQITVRLEPELYSALQEFDDKPSEVVRQMIRILLPHLKK